MLDTELALPSSIPPVPLGVPLTPDHTILTRLTREVIASGRYTNTGALARRLEDELAEYLDVPHAVLVSSGTAALTLALLDLDVPAGSEVITSPLTFIATASAIRAAGLRACFADVDPRTGNLDPQAVETTLSENTRAIVPVHLFGQPCDVSGFQQLARTHELAVVYDAAHAFGAATQGGGIGGHGQASAFSLHATKLMHTGEGGLITTTNAERAARLRVRRNFGLQGDVAPLAGINAKLPELSAALGLAVLPTVAAERGARAALARCYDEIFTGHDVPVLRGTDAQAYLFYAIAPTPQQRAFIVDGLTRSGLTPRPFPLLNDAAPARISDAMSLPPTPKAASLAARIIALPMHSGVTQTHLELLNVHLSRE